MSDQADKIEELLSRAVENIYPNRGYLENLLKSKKKLTVYLGIDPTGPTLHLGHMINIRKLKQFQDLGHRVILLLGSFTAMIGDPTDKAAVRKKLTREQVLDNAKLYKEQISHYLDFEGKNPAELKYNSEWFDAMTFRDVVELASRFTVGQMLARDMFQKRMQEDKPIFLHEFLYPLMQGYDSAAMDVDGELGGNDQTFNMLCGRDLMKELKGKEKFVLAMKLLVDPTGKKMGKTEGNMVSFVDTAEDMYGKVMSWGDEMITSGFELCTGVDMGEVASMKKSMEEGANPAFGSAMRSLGGINPRDFKMKLAFEIVKDYYGKDLAVKGEEHFKKVVQKHEAPSEIPEFRVKESKKALVDLLVLCKLAPTRSGARRLIEQKAIKINEQVIEDVHYQVEIPKQGVILQKGKLHFVKIIY